MGIPQQADVRHGDPQHELSSGPIEPTEDRLQFPVVLIAGLERVHKLYGRPALLVYCQLVEERPHLLGDSGYGHDLLFNGGGLQCVLLPDEIERPLKPFQLLGDIVQRLRRSFDSVPRLPNLPDQRDSSVDEADNAGDRPDCSLSER